MDCKIIFRLFLIIFFITTPAKSVEFKGKFLQGHYIIGITDPSAQIIIDKKASSEQLKAIETILSGEDTEETATI